MASALLASRAEPLWGERKVYARKAPTNPNPNSKTIAIANPNPNPNPNLNTIELESVSPGVSDEWANSSSHEHHQKETNHGGYVTFNIAAYTKREMKDLKKRLLLELETVQNLRKRIESTNFPNKRPRTETPAAREAVAKMMKQCGQILGKLMKHKFSWIFNSPVDVVGLGLHDYNQIIKHPMDLGTVKTKLGKNLYSTPEEFESDVMLTFNNAITYNPQGHDVYVMAHKLRASFQKMFGNAYAKYNNERRRVIALAEQEMKWSADRDRCYEQRRPLPVPVQVPIHSVYSNTPTPEPVRRPDPMPAMQSMSIPPSPVQASRPMPQSVEAAVPVVKTLPKPKARDLNKRNMTFEEKRKLSESLESLPQEKMDQVVQIMRRKNAALSQNDDEIEVDIEVLDKETLWELDRFVSNHRKTMCKSKRQQELEQNNRNFSAPVEEGNKSPGSEMTQALAPVEKTNKVEAVGMDEDIDIGEDIPTNNFPPVEIEKDAGYASGGGTSSSSSSSSGSSSSSDSGSSSDSDSDDDEAQSPNHDAKGKGSPG